jgi:MFS family permease
MLRRLPVIFFAALTAFFSGPGQTFGLSNFVDKYIEDFGWSRSHVSTLYAFATVGSGFIVPTLGGIIDKLGHRRSSLIIAILFSCACMLSSLATGSMFVFLGMFLSRLLGQGGLTLIAKSILPHHVQTKRGIATALMGLGFTASQTFVPLINNHMVSTQGWRTCWQMWAVLFLVVYLPLSQLLLPKVPSSQVCVFVFVYRSHLLFPFVFLRSFALSFFRLFVLVFVRSFVRVFVRS